MTCHALISETLPRKAVLVAVALFSITCYAQRLFRSACPLLLLPNSSSSSRKPNGCSLVIPGLWILQLFALRQRPSRSFADWSVRFFCFFLPNFFCVAQRLSCAPPTSTARGPCTQSSKVGLACFSLSRGSSMDQRETPYYAD